MFGKPRAVRKRSSSSSGLRPGSSFRKTFITSSSPNTSDEFDCSTPIGRTSTSSASSLIPSTRWKLNSPSSVLDRLLGVDPPQQLAPVRRLRQRVVDRPRRASRDRSSEQHVGGAGHAERQLVELVRAGGEARLEQAEHQQRRLVGEHDALQQLDRRHLARLGRVPALALDPGADRLHVERGGSPPAMPFTASGTFLQFVLLVSWNQ